MRDGKLLAWIMRWGPPLLWMGLIFLVSSFPKLPSPPDDQLNFWLKKSAHMIEYGILFYLWQRAFNWEKSNSQKSYWESILISVAYAASDEWHQSFVPGRVAHIRDVGFDMLGVMVVYVVLKVRQNLSEKNSAK